MAAKQRFCSTRCRVYANREGLYADTADRKQSAETEGDWSVAAALRAAQAFSPVPVPDHKTVAAIRVKRPHADPSTWQVLAPSSSALAAAKIREALTNHIGDLLTLANKLGAVADEPLLVIGTRKRK
jgi:hypothetical protein